MTPNTDKLQFAPVAPIQVLEALYQQSPETFGEYHLLLAHHTKEQLPKFKALFEQIQSDGVIDPVIIMDNSLVELGSSVDFNMINEVTWTLMEACPNALVYPVLPDVMGNGPETRALVAEHYDHWSAEMAGSGFMAVCQGNDWDDYILSLKTFSNQEKYSEILWLGVPRVLYATLGTRVHAAARAGYVEGRDHWVHLLGFSDNIEDDWMSARQTGIQGIDSAVPLRMKEHFKLDAEVGPRPADWFEQAQLDPLMLQNLQDARTVFTRG